MRTKRTDSDGREILSGRELARELRRRAYREAKQRRAQDPSFIARQLELKAEAKRRRKELYQRVKEQKRAQIAEARERAKAGTGGETAGNTGGEAAARVRRRRPREAVEVEVQSEFEAELPPLEELELEGLELDGSAIGAHGQGEVGTPGGVPGMRGTVRGRKPSPGAQALLDMLAKLSRARGRGSEHASREDDAADEPRGTIVSELRFTSSHEEVANDVTGG